MLDEALKSTSPAVAAVTGILVNISDISSNAGGGQSPEAVTNTTTAMSSGLSTTLSPTAKYATSKWFYFTESPELAGSQLEQSVVPVAIWKSFQVVHTIMMIMALLLNCLSLGIIYGIVPKLTPPLQLITSLAFAEMLAPWAIMTMYFPASSCQDEITQRPPADCTQCQRRDPHRPRFLPQRGHIPTASVRTHCVAETTMDFH